MKLTRVFKQKGPAEGSKDVQMIFDGGDAIAIYHIYQRCWYACIDVIDCKRGISKVELLKTVAEAIHKQEPELLCMNYLASFKEKKVFEEAGWTHQYSPRCCREDEDALYSKDLPAIFRDKDGNELHIGDKVSFNIYDNNWTDAEIVGFDHYDGYIRLTYEEIKDKPIRSGIAYNPKGNQRLKKKEA